MVQSNSAVSSININNLEINIIIGWLLFNDPAAKYCMYIKEIRVLDP